MMGASKGSGAGDKRTGNVSRDRRDAPIWAVAAGRSNGGGAAASTGGAGTGVRLDTESAAALRSAAAGSAVGTGVSRGRNDGAQFAASDHSPRSIGRGAPTRLARSPSNGRVVGRSFPGSTEKRAGS